MTNLGIRSETIEFKEGKKQFDKGVKTLSAMLNSHHGGTVYFGVNENGDVIGLDLCETASEKILESIDTYIRPRIIPKIEILTSDDDIQYISVSATSEHPIYSFDDRYFIRDGNSNVIASPEYLVHLIRPVKNKQDVEQPDDPQTSGDLDQNLKKVLSCLKKNDTIKLTEVSKKTGLSLSAVKKYVTELKRREYVKNIGTNRNSRWVVNQK